MAWIPVRAKRGSAPGRAIGVASVLAFGISALVWAGAAGAQTRVTSSDPGPRSSVPSPASCPVRFHDHLARVRAADVKALIVAYASLTEPGQELPGRWQFTSPVPSSAEAAVRSALASFVTARGASPDYRNKGRLGWFVRRIAYDLDRYTAQPLHPALCTGTMEMLSFYDGRLAPLHRQQEAVAATLDEARAVAEGRWSVLAGPRLLASVTSPAAQAAATAPLATPVPARPSSPDSPLMVPPPERLAGELARAAVDALAGDTTPAGPATAITLADLPVIAEAVSALDEASQGVSKETREAARAALAAVEALLYAEQHARTLDAFRTRLLTTMDAIADAHMVTCTCAP